MNKLTPTKDNKDGMEDNIPASLLGHKKLLIKRSIPAPPMYQNSSGGCAATTQLKFSTEVKVKVDKHASGMELSTHNTFQVERYFLYFPFNFRLFIIFIPQVR